MSARLVIAAPRSGEGKTSITLGLIAALAARGLHVGSAKVGPDYLDTGWHALATGRAARNLDAWTMGEAGVRAGFTSSAKGTDVVIVEGVMGLFDGHRTDAGACSTADIARLLDAPVVLVVDASRAAASLAALAHGFGTFDPRIRVRGVILNRFADHRDRSAVTAAFERAEIPVLGWVPLAAGAVLPSRHLGLIQAAEDRAAGGAAISRLGEMVEEHCDVDSLLALARSVESLLPVEPPWAALREDAWPTPRIAMARDDAFAFTYADNPEALRDLGAQVVEFSPLADATLPAGTDGVYLPGGYPELFAEQLAGNASMRESLAAACEEGVPVFAECGGMLYLLESLTDADGRELAMTGVLPGRARMLPRLQRVGYVEATLATAGILGEGGSVVRGHEFRYSTCEPAAGETPAWLVDGESHGFAAGNVVASYLHVNFAGCPKIAASFVGSCRQRAAARLGEPAPHTESGRIA
ncbi:MAG: cobyrinate a,c-diamide synthase [Coriobacteriia bacterium]|nr:cobyrinate a,c-diamide synthase [Coriobacteriia bacterium]